MDLSGWRRGVCGWFVVAAAGCVLGVVLVSPSAAASEAVSVVEAPAEPGLGACTVVGTPGDDVLVGTQGDDVICGLGGDDVLHGRGGDDVLRGGPGDDVLHGGRGSDRLYGGRGGDRLYGKTGDDLLFGGRGRDRLYGQAGDDRLAGGRGADTLVGGRGEDWLDGGPGRDRAAVGPGDRVRSVEAPRQAPGLPASSEEWFLVKDLGAHAAPDPAAQALANRVVLRAGDLPAGWQLFPPLGEEIEDVVPCLTGRVDLSGLTVAAEAFSLAAAEPSSGGESVSVVFSDVSVLQDTGQAMSVFERVAGAYMGCAADAAAAVEEAGPLGGLVGVSVERLEFPALGEESAAWRTQIRLGDPELGGPEAVVNVSTDIVHVRTGRLYLLLAFSGFPAPFDPALAEQLAHTITQRIPPAGG